VLRSIGSKFYMMAIGALPHGAVSLPFVPLFHAH